MICDDYASLSSLTFIEKRPEPNFSFKPDLSLNPQQDEQTLKMSQYFLNKDFLNKAQYLLSGNIPKYQYRQSSYTESQIKVSLYFNSYVKMNEMLKQFIVYYNDLIFDKIFLCRYDILYFNDRKEDFIEINDKNYASADLYMLIFNIPSDKLSMTSVAFFIDKRTFDVESDNTSFKLKKNETWLINDLLPNLKKFNSSKESAELKKSIIIGEFIDMCKKTVRS